MLIIQLSQQVEAFFRQENIHKIGKIIYLESSFEGILNRIHSAPNAKAKLKKETTFK